jgi:hypothetical protein
LSVPTQTLPHFAKPGLHVLAQLPSVHVAVPLAGTSQARPQPLQLSGSVLMSIQLAPHGV